MSRPPKIDILGFFDSTFTDCLLCATFSCIMLFNQHSEVAQSWPTLCDPMDCSLPGFSVMGFSRQEYWSGLPLPSPGDLPDPGIKPGSPASEADALTSEPPGNSLG